MYQRMILAATLVTYRSRNDVLVSKVGNHHLGGDPSITQRSQRLSLSDTESAKCLKTAGTEYEPRIRPLDHSEQS